MRMIRFEGRFTPAVLYFAGSLPRDVLYSRKSFGNYGQTDTSSDIKVAHTIAAEVIK